MISGLRGRVTTGLTKSGEASEKKESSARYGIVNDNTEFIFHNIDNLFIKWVRLVVTPCLIVVTPCVILVTLFAIIVTLYIPTTYWLDKFKKTKKISIIRLIFAI